MTCLQGVLCACCFRKTGTRSTKMYPNCHKITHQIFKLQIPFKGSIFGVVKEGVDVKMTKRWPWLSEICSKGGCCSNFTKIIQTCSMEDLIFINNFHQEVFSIINTTAMSDNYSLKCFNNTVRNINKYHILHEEYKVYVQGNQILS